MKTVIVFGILVSVSYALINDIDEDCIGNIVNNNHLYSLFISY
jgi:hypothetical protein